MQTRSMTMLMASSSSTTTTTAVKPERKIGKKPLEQNDVNRSIIDFDESSKEWRANKISIGNGCFKYKKRKQ